MVALESESDVLDHGDLAPEFELEGTDGETYTLGDFDDHDALLVVFTCNHCPYAKAKYGAMNDIAADYEDVAVVGINPNDAEEYPEDSFEKMVEYVERGDIDITAYLRDDTQEVAEAYGAVCTPDPFLFRNDNDDFRLVYHGRFDDATNPDEEPSGRPGYEIRGAIESVLAGETPDAEDHPSRGCSIKWRD
ncbi:redoxin domain-containing protein [Natronomonas sp. CBA1123]|jgi:peroxiredoxin|uniref:thioredoxin family protein n=1 Tax=Natronomonas sp. CBA1123 TaxID=2668070 RepID=UPI0012EAB88C|nr:thioredoxin family protein [Natronomonas sp. CBA1123]MUV87210.1 redoxin domain-containing protein [Natronomonas sp. CBA1123]